MQQPVSVDGRERDRDRDRDRERARQVALGGLILRGLVGSTVHGRSNPGTDDRDEMGVCVEPAAYVSGLREFDHDVSRTQPGVVPSGPGDCDLTIYGLLRRPTASASTGSWWRAYPEAWA